LVTKVVKLARGDAKTRAAPQNALGRVPKARGLTSFEAELLCSYVDQMAALEKANGSDRRWAAYHLSQLLGKTFSFTEDRELLPRVNGSTPESAYRQFDRINRIFTRAHRAMNHFGELVTSRRFR
jgi:hypothetical protein